MVSVKLFGRSNAATTTTSEWNGRRESFTFQSSEFTYRQHAVNTNSCSHGCRNTLNTHSFTHSLEIYFKGFLTFSNSKLFSIIACPALQKNRHTQHRIVASMNLFTSFCLDLDKLCVCECNVRCIQSSSPPGNNTSESNYYTYYLLSSHFPFQNTNKIQNTKHEIKRRPGIFWFCLKHAPQKKDLRLHLAHVGTFTQKYYKNVRIWIHIIQMFNVPVCKYCFCLACRRSQFMYFIIKNVQDWAEWQITNCICSSTKRMESNKTKTKMVKKKSGRRWTECRRMNNAHSMSFITNRRVPQFCAKQTPNWTQNTYETVKKKNNKNSA